MHGWPRVDSESCDAASKSVLAMTAPEEFAAFAAYKLQPILNASGFVLYSAAATLRPMPIYLMGHNPGGSPERQADATVGASLASLPGKTMNNYLDEPWTTASGRSWTAGQAPLQRRVAWLLNQLGFDPREVPCSNLIFTRSVEVSSGTFDEMAALCWPVHERIIEIVDPRVLLVFGNSEPSPYTYLQEIWGGGIEERIRAGHGNWDCRKFKARNGRSVIGIPHLSRYNVIGKNDVIDWIHRHLAL
jgi:hypothetical protein